MVIGGHTKAADNYILRCDMEAYYGSSHRKGSRRAQMRLLSQPRQNSWVAVLINLSLNLD